MKVVIDYRPSYKQYIYHTTDADEVLYGGAAGGGKTKATVMDAFARCMAYPGTLAVIFRRTYSELEDTVIAEAKRSYPPEIAKYNVARHECMLPNGSKILFRHCASVEDMYNYRGLEVQWLYFDELTSFEETQYDFIRTRLRAPKMLGVKPITRSTSNPGGIGHGWVKTRFVDAAPYMQKVRKDVYSAALHKTQTTITQYIPALATENPHITQDYIFELEQKPEALRNALLYGHWDAFEGQVFVEWRNDPSHYRDHKWTHVIDPFEIPAHWPRYMSFDYGYSKPFSCGWWALAPDGVAYRYREWYGWDGHANVGLKLAPRQIAEGIIEREEEERREGITIMRVADPAIFDASRGESIAQMMEPISSVQTTRGAGVYFEKGDNARLAGLMQMHERLRFDERGRPKMQIFSSCPQFIRTIPNLPYDLKHVEDVDTDSEDHIFDEAKYFLMCAPMPIALPPKKKIKQYSPFEPA